jgi:hypothetical protein
MIIRNEQRQRNVAPHTDKPPYIHSDSALKENTMAGLHVTVARRA